MSKDTEDIELRSMGTKPPSYFTDMIVKMPRPISQKSYDKVVEWVQFLRKCSNQQFDNMLEQLEMAKDGLVDESVDGDTKSESTP